jgi:hypothetical protein
VRHGFTPMLVVASVMVLILGGIFAVFPALPGVGWDAWPVLLIFTLPFGALGLSWLIGAWRHPPALRLDEDGVTFGRSIGLITYHGLRWRLPRVVMVPWIDIDAVVLFRLSNGRTGGFEVIGLRLREEAALPRGEPAGTGAWQDLNAGLGQARLPREIAMCRQIWGWRLGEKQLRQQIKRFTPHVRVIQLGTLRAGTDVDQYSWP